MRRKPEWRIQLRYAWRSARVGLIAALVVYYLFLSSRDLEWYNYMMYAGCVLNLLVLSVNGLRMPVKSDEFYYEDWSIHRKMTKRTRLNLLGDWIDIKLAIMSPGDILIWTGLIAPFLYWIVVSLKGLVA